jgi:phage terminase, small subunit
VAKDGTNRGGARPGAGAKKKPLADKITDGNPGKRKLTVIDFSETADLEGQPMPKPPAMLSATQKDGKPLGAAEIYEATWKWLAERNCTSLVSPQLLERYAMSAARWIQCEQAVTDYGFLAKHPTTGNAIQSPYVSMSQNYMSQTNRLWMEIFQIVKENCSSEYTGANPQDDLMEKLLRTRKGN